MFNSKCILVFGIIFLLILGCKKEENIKNEMKVTRMKIAYYADPTAVLDYSFDYTHDK